MSNMVECNMIMNNLDKKANYYDVQSSAMSFLGTLSPAASSVDSADMKMHSPISASMSPTNLPFTTQLLLDDVNGMPFLNILEQPVEKFRFRYKSEMVGTHGSLTGMNSDKIRKNTYPTVQLHNYDGPAIIRCSLFQIKSNVPHAHRLVIKAGNGEKDDPHDIEVSIERGYTAVFQGMGIIHTAKKHLITELTVKKMRLLKEDQMRNGIFRKLTHLEEAEVNRQAETESKNINLNTVRLKFEAFQEDVNGALKPLCHAVYSHGINNLKSALTGELKIVRMDHTTTSCTGGQEIFILVEKVTKNNIRVRFFECDEDDNEIWSDFGKFSHIDVHHQYAIVFKAPPYRDINIENTVEVCIELVRPSDGARSEPRVFKYKPSEKIGKKRARYSESLSSNELPATINNMSFDCSISLPESMIKDDFFANPDNLSSEEFANLFLQVREDYTDITNEPRYLTTDGASSGVCALQTNTENIKIVKKVVNSLMACLKAKPAPEDIERLVNNLFHDCYTSDGNNALHTSILCEQFQHLQYILVLLSKMKHLKTIDIKNNFGETALHLAVKMNNPTVVNLLLPVGADPNLVDTKGNTPLHIVLLSESDLQDYKCLVDVTEINTENDEGYTPLHLAVLTSNLKSVEILVRANANVNEKHRSNGNTALHMAVEEKSKEIVKFLLHNSCARIDCENYTRTTPVHLAKLLATEGDVSQDIFDIMCHYIKDKGFESLIIKTEPEDDDSSSEESEIINIKSEPVSPEPMETDVEIMALKDMEFSEECIGRLSKILDDTEILQKMARDLDFESIQSTLTKLSTRILLNYANVTGASVFAVRELLYSYGSKEAVKLIDLLCLNKK